jgi:hypothetical protein
MYVPDSIAVCLSSREEMYCLNVVNISSKKYFGNPSLVKRQDSKRKVANTKAKSGLKKQSNQITQQVTCKYKRPS